MYFLERVAEQLYEDYGSSLNRHCLVFPNRRAGLFLMKHLAAKAGKPLWAPRSVTINELFNDSSRHTIASTENLVFELYRLYRALAKTEETFDNFYFWGEMLLNDFDDVDKYLVDARALFTNISDLHAIDEKFGGLTPEQMEVIKQFVENFRAGSDSDQKRDFEFTWSLLFPLYESFRELLATKGLAYEGMVFRGVVTSLSSDTPPEGILNEYEQYHFIGFNALNNCEKKLLSFLKKSGKARFYWDIEDNMYFREDPKAGFFIRPNIGQFGQDLIWSAGGDDKGIRHSQSSSSTCSNGGSTGPGNDIDAIGRTTKTGIGKIRIIDIPSDTGQAKLLPNLLESLNIVAKAGEHHRTAVILADENLLPAVLSSIPPVVTDINVTMGYPFSMTVVYSLLRALLDLQERPYNYGNKILYDYRKVMPVLSNPLVVRSAGAAAAEKAAGLIKRNAALVPATYFDDNEFLSSLFKLTDDAVSLCNYLRSNFLTITTALSNTDDEAAEKDPLTPEFLYRANQVLNRLEPILSDQTVTITRETFIRLADRIFREIKVPFRGEPLRGIQIMGLLESRALDFDNLIILSANEGVMPKSSAGASYIPYNLREVFGLPTINHQDSIYSYYFTRLCSRAKQMIFVYNSSPEGLRTGEMSRFLLRIKYSPDFSPEYLSAYTRMNQRPLVPEVRERAENDIVALEKRYLSGEESSSLSPSAINTWLNCSMKFYYAYVCDLREADRITAGIDPAKFGTILHEVVSKIYEPFTGQIVSSATISKIAADHLANTAIIDDVLGRVYYGGTGAPVTGTGLLTADIVAMYLKKVLNIDDKLAPFTMVSLEESYKRALSINYGGSERELFLGGKIDRIDERGGIRRLIDYKTGSAGLEVRSPDDLFETDKYNLNDAATQTLIYCVIMSDKVGYERLRPVIYALRSGSGGDFDDRLTIAGSPVDDFSLISERFTELLKATMTQMFDRNHPFIKTTVKVRCGYCPYRKLCQR
jgi:hypothetical protein